MRSGPMTSENSATEAPVTMPGLRRLARASAWLLLVSIVVLVVTGWGITTTGIIYRATFGLMDRRLADAIHRATNLPLAVFFLSHVLINIRLAIARRNPRRVGLINGILIVAGVLMMALFLYVEYWA